jgi:RNA recognition motif-containing protein
MNNKLYVGNLSYSTTEDSLRDMFAQAGNIRSVSVMMDRVTNQPRGFAFVEMETPAEALKAIQMCNGQELDGRTLKVNEAKPPEQRSNGGGGYNSGGGSYNKGGNRNNDRRSNNRY